VKSLRILLVDDDVSLGTLLGAVLEGMGHVVCGREATEAGAVETALATRPDLMIVDQQLQAGSGAAAVVAIARVATIPHILMGGGRPPAIGSVSFLQKPFAVRDLVTAIERTSGLPKPA
jgi:DNA-binding NtrC family response regulator